jgi:hypothetical protein
MWRTLITKQRKYSRLNTSTRGYELYKRWMMRRNIPNRVCVGLKKSVHRNKCRKEEEAKLLGNFASNVRRCCGRR